MTHAGQSVRARVRAEDDVVSQRARHVLEHIQAQLIPAKAARRIFCRPGWCGSSAGNVIGVDLPHDPPAFVSVEPVDEQPSVQVVGLVLQAPGQLAGS